VTDLPAALAQSAGELADAIIERHGGRGAMTIIDLEVVASMVRVFNAMRAADVDVLPRLIDSLAKLEGMLSAPSRARSPLQALHDHIATTHGVPS
jgi:hypothetical protein